MILAGQSSQRKASKDAEEQVGATTVPRRLLLAYREARGRKDKAAPVHLESGGEALPVFSWAEEAGMFISFGEFDAPAAMAAMSQEGP